MSAPVSWFRWYRGRVWHVGFAQDAAACGSERPADAETVGERAPANARVCGDCVAASLHLYAMAQAGQMGDPRNATVSFTIEPDLTGFKPAVETARQPVDLVAALQASMDAARHRRGLPRVGDDEWPCGNCGHANLDHDCDDGTCTVTNDDPGVDWAECPCPTLTPAG